MSRNHVWILKKFTHKNFSIFLWFWTQRFIYLEVEGFYYFHFRFFITLKKNREKKHSATLFLPCVASMCTSGRCCFRTNLMFHIAAASPPPAGPLSATRTPQSRLNGWEALWKTVAPLLPSCAPTSVSKAQHSDGYIEFRTRIFFFKAWQWLPLQLYLTLNAVLLSRARSSKLSPESANRLITHKTLFIMLHLNGHFWNVPLWLQLNECDMVKCHKCHCHWAAGASCLQGGKWPDGRGQDNWSDDERTLPSLDGAARARDLPEPQHK